MVYKDSYYLLYSCTNPILGKSGSCDMGQNALGQSDCRIFKLIIFPEHKDEKAWLFACWYRLMDIKSWLENIGVSMVKNGCGHSGLKTLYLKIGCISKRNQWNKLVFGVLIKIHLEDNGHFTPERAFMILKQTFRG